MEFGARHRDRLEQDGVDGVRKTRKHVGIAFGMESLKDELTHSDL